MLAFFRRIRQQLLSENKFSKYLLYAFGEIILVVIGILIALQINNWNEERKNTQLEKNYLISISTDLENLSLNTQRIYVDQFDEKIENLLFAKKYIEVPFAIVDTLQFINTISKGAASFSGFYLVDDEAYQELVSTGNLRLIRNDSLRKDLSEFYTDMKVQAELSKRYNTEYGNYINAIRPFNNDNPSYVNLYDVNEFLEELKTKKFRQLVDHELTYGYRTRRMAKNVVKNAQKLKERVEEEIK
ncbi:DUF6090 family protein [Flagellimonas zhangzhouensis]|uniref:Uncharacterized protein n=1 Tax=Flagellimonas zhangzhouensis TaxID=1073328 RepID=A0A1H2Y0F4_9FLAO|nr:DUF6090 family protein [Allomuricauda zhangzhouensis]SDQ93978.1 hypothetical protein SAMN05216294_2926 [Allomuricauda zhangzhouensis]SDW98616.1 hypothetical protein SAMN04487892_2918 [Allomuricauda zhangzhouensis]